MSLSERQPVDPIEAEAQFIHTEAYLRENIIIEDELSPDGIFRDEYTPRAEPILAKIGGRETALRMIHTDKKQGGLLSLPTLKHFSVDPHLLREVAHASRLSEINPRRVVEISGLGAIRADGETTTTDIFDTTLRAYSIGLRRSLDQGHSLWVMNMEDKLKRNLELRLGKGALTQIGEERQYMGPPTTPFALNPQDIVASMLRDGTGRYRENNRSALHQTMQGVRERHVSSKLAKLMHEHDISTEKDSLVSKAWQNKKAILYGGIIGYSALRFIPLSFVGQFDGSIPLFAGIDVGTAITQTIGMEWYFKGKTRTKRALGAATALASFVAPYAYVAATNREGSPLEYPWYVDAAAGFFASIGVGLEVNRTLIDNKLQRGLEHTDLRASSQ